MAFLDEALHLEGNKLLQPGKVLLVKDCVATSGAFILTHLIKKIFCGTSDSVVSSKASSQNLLQSGLVLFVGLSEPFTHYERIARKLGFNLSAYRDNGQFIFIDGLHLECKGSNGPMTESALIELYKSIHQTLHGCVFLERNMGCNCIVIDDVSLLEIAAHGSEDCVLDFLHYCRILSLDMGCSLVLLSHQDIYASLSDPRFIKHLEYFADIMIDVEPLNSGIATDVHGQMEEKDLFQQDIPAFLNHPKYSRYSAFVGLEISKDSMLSAGQNESKRITAADLDCLHVNL